MLEDDIDWANAASDFGLVLLCRQAAALADPPLPIANLQTIASARRRINRRRTRWLRKPRVITELRVV